MASVQYNFTNLNSVKIGEICNVFGLVKYCSKIEKTKGKDFKMTISITDQSLGFENKLICNLFHERPENLPKVTDRGDVIIIHRLKINKYLGKPQGIGIQKQGYLVAVFFRSNSFDISNEDYHSIVEKMSTNSHNFNITMSDLKQVQDIMEWGNEIPSSQYDDIEFNLDHLSIVKLEEITPGIAYSMAVQVISIVSLEYLEYRSLLLVFDGTLPSFDLDKQYLKAFSNCKNSKHHPVLMAKLGGKISNPHVTPLFMKHEIDLQQFFVRPGDFIYLTGVITDTSLIDHRMFLVADQSKIGIIPPEAPIYQTLTNRLTNLNGLFPCVADCISSDIDHLSMWTLQDFGKILKQLEVEDNDNDDNSYKFKLVSKVVNVHPSTEKEFFDSIILYCTCCQEVKHNLSISNFRADSITGKCLKNLIPIPMLTLVFEDFSGWLTCVMVGKAVLDMLNLVMIDASQVDWWVNLFANKDKESVISWIHHLSRLKEGWVEAKLVLKAVSDGKIFPFIENMVILDY